LALVAAVAGWLWLPGLARFWASDYHTDWGERRELVLADHSQVLLNTHSGAERDK
jgi:transmembrane sensor